MTERKRVLVIGLGSEAYGRERRVVTLFRHAQLSEPFFLISPWGDGSVDALLRENHFEFATAPFGYLGRAHPRYSATTLARMPELTATILREYRRRHCDAVLVGSLHGFANALVPMLLLRARGARICFYLGDWLAPSTFARAVAPFVRWTAKRIVTNSDSGRRDLATVGIGGVDVIYNGVVLERFTNAAAMPFRTAHSWGPETIVVGFAGRFTRAKGVWELVRAAELLVGRGSKCRFVMIGNVGHHDSIQAELAAHAKAQGFEPQLAFAGHVCDMPSAYAGLDVMVVPSLSDTLPNVILEAMASGVPVIATRVGGIPEVVDSDIGALVEPGDVSALAEAIESLALDEARRRRAGERARERARATFDATQNAARVERAMLGLD